MKWLSEMWNMIVKKERNESRRTADEVRFAEEVRGQFLQLRKKGLSIPIFTL